mmetsp:Transcript_7486/g.22731  ORF Transcript_7486/g.22731 Transcript_7486/m.22731 type:complete len:139 (+) Transcript_7486:251-667(+)
MKGTVAGCVPVKHDVENSTTQVLMITSRKKSSRWIFPKGKLEDGETEEETAAREAKEEGGVVGTICRRIQYTSGGSKFPVMFILNVQALMDDWLEDAERQRRWFPMEEALHILRADSERPELYAVLSRADQMLREGST